MKVNHAYENLLTIMKKKYHSTTDYFTKHNNIVKLNKINNPDDPIESIPESLEDKLKLISKYPLLLDTLLLRLELLFIPSPKIMTFDEVIKETNKIINRYQWKGGGYFIDSLKWDLITSKDNTSEYNIAENEVILVNTIKKELCYEHSNIDYFDLLINKLNGISKNHTFNFQHYKAKDSSYSRELVIWITENK